MLKLTICILVVAVIWGSTFAKNIDGKLGYCPYGDLKIKLGETVPAPIGECTKVTCTSVDPPEVSALTCALWQLAPGSKCHQSEIDLTKQYPDCCPQEVCPGD